VTPEQALKRMLGEYIRGRPAERRAVAATLRLKVRSAVRRTLDQFLLVDAVRYVVARLRYQYFMLGAGDVRIHNLTEAVSPNTVRYNLIGLSDLAVARSSKLVRPLSVIETLSSESRVLAIGPRTEGELLNLVAHGFGRANIRGLDLISYSPWVDLGDVHAMPYADNTWDVVLAGWVLAYSADRKRAAAEIVRVARRNAVVAVAVEYNPLSTDEIMAERGYSVGTAERVTSVDELLDLFRGHVATVYFAHNVAPERRTHVGNVSAIFSIEK